MIMRYEIVCRSHWIYEDRILNIIESDIWKMIAEGIYANEK